MALANPPFSFPLLFFISLSLPPYLPSSLPPSLTTSLTTSVSTSLSLYLPLSPTGVFCICSFRWQQPSLLHDPQQKLHDELVTPSSPVHFLHPTPEEGRERMKEERKKMSEHIRHSNQKKKCIGAVAHFQPPPPGVPESNSLSQVSVQMFDI